MKILENNNRKFIKTLSGNCLKANKGRNGIAILAIMLTAVLFMALTTVFQGAQESFRIQMLRQAGTKFMVSVKGLTREEAEELASDPAFMEAGMARYVGYAMNKELDNINAAIGWVDEATAKNSFMELEDGHYPEKENEIVCDSEILALLGLPYETGSTFNLRYSTGEASLKKQMIVCGIFKGMKHEQSTSLLVSQAFVDQVLEGLTGEYAFMKEASYDVRGSFADENDIEEKLAELVEKLGYDPDAERGEEGFLIHHINPVYESASMDSPQMYAYAGMGVLLILLAGYLIIYNIFKISIEKDIRMYGQLKTIGMSPKQIRYMVMRQGMVLSVAGIPAGLVLGWLVGNALLPAVMANTLAGEASFIVPSWWIWLLSGFFTLITVRVSCNRPGKAAGKISPVEALNYHGAQDVRKAQKKGKESDHRIMSMAAANLGRDKGKTVLVVLSVSFSAVLLNCVLNYTGSMDEETYVRHGMITDFDVRSASFEKYGEEDYQKVVSEYMMGVLEQIDGVTDFGKVYCQMLPDENRKTGDEDCGKITRINGKDAGEVFEDFDEYRMLYGMDENVLLRTDIIEGSIDYEKLCTGDYVVMAGNLSNDETYDYEAQEFHAGDVIKAEVEGKEKDYTVMAVVGMKESLCMSYSNGGYEAMVFAESVFLDMFLDMQTPIHCLFNAREGRFDDVNEEVNRTAQANNLSVQSRLTAEEEFKETQNSYNAVGIVVSVILGVIGILNLINVILTGVIARQREFASMRSIGMTKKQLQKLMIYEGMIYAVLAGVIGILLGAVLSVTLVKNLSANIWYLKYQFTVLPAVIVSGICLLLSAGISAMTDKVWNKGSIVEQLREN